MVANFRTYDGQLRLLTSVIAAHPDLKLNYKEIAKHFGSDWGESGIEHFFRPIKKNGKAIQAMVKRGEDAANFNHNAFQFRAIKKDAENMRQGKGSSVGATPTTPSSAATPKTPRTTGARKRAAPSTGKSTASKKLKENTVKFTEDLTADAGDDSDNEFALLNLTPSKNGVSINEEKMRAHEQSMGIFYASETPALGSTQATTPDEDDDLKIMTPADAGPAFSFNQPAASQTPSYPVGNGISGSWDNNAFSAGNAYDSDPDQKGYADGAYVDEC